MMLVWSSTSQDSLHGRATYYSPGLMETVAANRGMDLTGYLGGVALNRRGDLGRIVWLEWPGGIEGPFLVVDCAQERHYKRRESKRLVVEVDAQTAMRQGFYGVGPWEVRVYFEDSVTCTIDRCPL